MQKNFTIDIPDPCTQSWSEMTDTASGKFCSHCSAEVIDFTQMNTAQLQAYFETAQVRVCGRINTYQLAQFNLQLPKPIVVQSIGLKIAFASAITFFVATRAFAQQVVESVSTSNHVSKFKKIAASNINANDIAMVLKGVVRAKEDDAVLVGVTVKANGLELMTATNTEGRFSLPLKGKEGQKLTLMFGYLGYETQQIQLVLSSQISDMEINLLPDNIILGEAVVVAPKEERRTVIVGGMIAVIKKRPSFFRRVMNAISKCFSNNHHQ